MASSFNTARRTWPRDEAAFFGPRIDPAEECCHARCCTRTPGNNGLATRFALEDTCRLALRNVIHHPLHVGACNVARPKCPNQRFDVTKDTPSIDCNGRASLWSPKPCHNQFGARRLEIFIAQFRNRDRRARFEFVTLWVASFCGDTAYLLSTPTRLMDRVRAI